MESISSNNAGLGAALRDAGIGVRQPAQQQTERAPTRQTPARQLSTQADLNYIPTPDSLRTKLENALQAKRSGQIIDRGGILNLLV